MELIDTHLHLIAPDQFDYAWTNDIAALADQDWSFTRFQSENVHTIRAAIFMECDVAPNQYKDEARYFSALSEPSEISLVGVVASCRPEEETGFEDWVEECIDLGVCGFRRILHVMPDGLSASEVFHRHIAFLGQKGKPFDLCVRQDQLPVAYELAKACPSTVFVLDHCGVPNIAGGGIEDWMQAISRLAVLENVVCKLSGVLAYCPPDARSYETIKPYLDHVLETFGPHRLLWGSDWPVVRIGGELAQWMACTEVFFSTLSDGEASAIAHVNAKRVYGLA